jgi:hypothetical protein
MGFHSGRPRPPESSHARSSGMNRPNAPQGRLSDLGEGGMPPSRGDRPERGAARRINSRGSNHFGRYLRARCAYANETPFGECQYRFTMGAPVRLCIFALGMPQSFASSLFHFGCPAAFAMTSCLPHGGPTRARTVRLFANVRSWPFP